MISYICKRIVGAIPVFFGITLIVFLMVSLAPATVLDLAGEGFEASSAEERAALEAQLGLSDPFLLRYAKWLGDLFQGDLGVSMRTGQPVAQSIGQRILPSVLLTGTGVLAGVILAVTLGVLAGWRPGSVWDKLASALSLLSFGVPSFCLSLLGIYVFSVTLRVLPSAGMYSGGMGGSVADLIRHLLLPASIICLSSMGNLLRQTKSALREVLGQDFIVAARAKGMSEAAVVWKHGLGAAAIPVLTTALNHIPHIVGGSMIVERIFGWPGLGSLLFLAVSKRDHTLIMGITVVVALSVLLAHLLMDILYRVLDPRLRQEGEAL